MSIKDLKSEIGESTWKLLILDIVTGGIYTFIWLIDRYRIFNRTAGKMIIDRNLIIASAVSLGIGDYITGFSDKPTGSVIGMLFTLGGGVIQIIIAFKLAGILEGKVQSEFRVVKHFNVFYLVIFNIFYINYIIQHLDQIEQDAKTTSLHSSTMNDQSQDDAMVQLEKLADMKDKGILTDDEFRAQKAKLLS